jgi:hypothetical protein
MGEIWPLNVSPDPWFSAMKQMTWRFGGVLILSNRGIAARPRPIIATNLSHKCEPGEPPREVTD